MEMIKKTYAPIILILVLVSWFVVVPVNSVVGRYNGRARPQARLFARRDCDKTNKHRGWKRNGGHTIGAHSTIANKWSKGGAQHRQTRRHGTVNQHHRHAINRRPISGMARNSNRIIPKPHHIVHVAGMPHSGRSYHVTNNIYHGVSHLKQRSQTDQAVPIIPSRPRGFRNKGTLKQIHNRNPAHQNYIRKTVHIKRPVVIAHKAPTPNLPLNVVHLVTAIEKKRHLLSKVGTHRLYKPFSLISNVCKNPYGGYRSPYLCFYATKNCHNTRCTLAGGICDLSRPCSYPFCEVSCVKPKCKSKRYQKKRIACPVTKTPMTSYCCINDQACPKGSICCHQPTGSECVSQA